MPTPREIHEDTLLEYYLGQSVPPSEVPGRVARAMARYDQTHPPSTVPPPPSMPPPAAIPAEASASVKRAKSKKSVS